MYNSYKKFVFVVPLLKVRIRGRVFANFVSFRFCPSLDHK